ncbi:hypothetical protein AB0C07_07190 [Actinoplanes missouriensis]|uniref:hypothetical protein n=1 Tax=Actinoplanes missouriensis TaxID=1866 RepID=UPI0033DD508B
MPDRIEELFADLRAETLPTVMPPGTGPLRRAARRRRTALSAAAAVAVLAVSGLVAVIRPGDTATPAAAPEISAAPVTEDSDDVAAALGIDPGSPDPGALAVFDAGDGLIGTTRDLLGGRYDMKMVCFGAGTIDVTVGSTEATVGCDTGQTTVLTVPFTVAKPEATVPITIRPHVAGRRQAFFGYLPVLSVADRTPYLQAAEAMLPEFDQHSIAAENFFLDHHNKSEDWSTAAGRYRIRAACAGHGSATLTVARTNDGVTTGPKSVPVPCGTAKSLVYDLTSGGLSIELAPDTEALGRSAGAILVEKA